MAQEKAEFRTEKKNHNVYLNVMELSAAFNEVIATPAPVPLTTAELHRWQVLFQAAIAQQLTMIAQHLGRIVHHASKVE